MVVSSQFEIPNSENGNYRATRSYTNSLLEKQPNYSLIASVNFLLQKSLHKHFY